jgi:hypothetical protein
MRITPLITAAACAALLVGPGLAAGDPPAGSPSGDHSNASSHPAAPDKPTAAPATEISPPGPDASPAARAKAYGKRCQGQSKKHVAGQQGTPFSQCVTAMAKVATSQANPTTACKALSKKHVAGGKGTPYSRCVVAAAKLHNEQ